MLSAGRLRDSLNFQVRRFSPTPSDMGGTEYEWQTVATVRASVTPMSGGEVNRAARLQGQTTYQVRCHCTTALRDAVSSVYRVQDARNPARFFNIVSLLIDDRQRTIDIIATAGPAVAT